MRNPPLIAKAAKYASIHTFGEAVSWEARLCQAERTPGGSSRSQMLGCASNACSTINASRLVEPSAPYTFKSAGVDARRRKLISVARQRTAGSAGVASCKIRCAFRCAGCVGKIAAIHTLVSMRDPGILQVFRRLTFLFELEQI